MSSPESYTEPQQPYAFAHTVAALEAAGTDEMLTAAQNISLIGNIVYGSYTSSFAKHLALLTFAESISTEHTHPYFRGKREAVYEMRDWLVKSHVDFLEESAEVANSFITTNPGALVHVQEDTRRYRPLTAVKVVSSGKMPARLAAVNGHKILGKGSYETLVCDVSKLASAAMRATVVDYQF